LSPGPPAAESRDGPAFLLGDWAPLTLAVHCLSEQPGQPLPQLPMCRQNRMSTSGLESGTQHPSRLLQGLGPCLEAGQSWCRVSGPTQRMDLSKIPGDACACL
jgi:hypothetical protein